MLAKTLSLLTLTLCLISCQTQAIQDTRINKELFYNENYVCKKVPNLINYTSPEGWYNGQRVIVLNREFFNCYKIDGIKPESVLKITYLGAVK